MAKTISLYGFLTVEPPDDIKEFLEEYSGEGTVLDVEFAQPKSEGARTRAIVEFTTSEAAQKIKSKSLDDEGLWYGNSYLKARDVRNDTAPARKVFQAQFIMDNITLHFGCQLELSYENIWHIELHRPRGQTKNFLLVQMVGGPKIFKKETHKASSFKEANDDQWVRDVDFSPSYSIGQSSALCLELPRIGPPPTFLKNFVRYKEDEGPFILGNGSTFCCESDLVPILSAAQLFELPYDIVFKVNSLVQHGCLSGPALDESFFRLINPSRIENAYIQHALEKMYHLKECCFDPARWLMDQYKKYRRLPAPPAVAIGDGLVFLRRVQITPTKLYFCGPEVNLSNRILRQYPDDIDNFLRISFIDEDLDKLFSANISPRTFSAIEGRQTKIYQRILSVQRNGIAIGSKRFEFLGFSQSQVRESSLWMFASRPGLTAADIREWMGDFREIKNVAKYAARLGQSLSSSRESFNIERHEMETIPDIEVKSDGVNYVFSDGIGKISSKLADSIARKLGFRTFTPSAFQIRYGGYKGVVAVDPTSSMKLSLRKSMSKYKSTNTSLDILEWSKYQACFLNREVITLLSTLGVKDESFLRKQKEAISQLDAILDRSSKSTGGTRVDGSWRDRNCSEGNAGVRL
ncbi:hypothetical protein OIU84_019022 [Salix udensis]|uniref:RNA-dependent RNA polymerase n=1 Tax=Salix udensis TaxID=889485 RepID=A0AAD6KZ88_9ROSI|nr:hypothetical protein OIU84_019022 [Salix udensis]